ncbi:hypothetical protein EON63_05725 [archaeon]|nr:MAG: hypothetical protein EON63_05725 [archaeon]
MLTNGLIIPTETPYNTTCTIHIYHTPYTPYTIHHSLFIILHTHHTSFTPNHKPHNIIIHYTSYIIHHTHTPYPYPYSYPYSLAQDNDIQQL